MVMPWAIGGLIDRFNQLHAGWGSGSTPVRSMRKFREQLQAHHYDADTIAAVNVDMVDGYAALREIVSESYYSFLDTARDLRNASDATGFEKMKLEWELEKNVVGKLMCEMMMLNISSLSETNKARMKLEGILKEREYDVDINEGFVRGYNIGMDIFMDAVSKYYAAMLCWDDTLR